MYNFDSYNVLLAIATNIAVLLKTGFVLQGHILLIIKHIFSFKNCYFKTCPGLEITRLK